MTEKQCFKCHQTKPLDDFYKHPQMADGHLNKCKECAKRDVNDNRAINLEYYQEYDRKRFQVDLDRRSYSINLSTQRAKQHPDKKSLSDSKWKKLNRTKANATCKLLHAIRYGRVNKPDSCQICDTTGKIHGHHHDYAKPLDVWWLCPSCHSLIHRLGRNAMRRKNDRSSMTYQFRQPARPGSA